MRPDHGPGVGVGHLARCLALGQAWSDLGGSVALASPGPLPTVWADRYAAESVEWYRSNGWVDGDALVLDGYGFGPVEQRDAPLGALLVLDDLGQVEIARADLVLDQNLSAVAGAAWPEGVRTLLGPRFALLRRDLASGAATHRESLPQPRSSLVVLVNAGGAPDPSWTEQLVQAVERTAPPEAEVVVVDGRQDMAALLPRVSVAVTAAGSTVWELLAFGVASVVVAFAGNQRSVARALGRGGFALDGGDHDGGDGALAVAVDLVLHDAALRAQLAARGLELVDGQGARRVARELAMVARGGDGAG